VIHTGISFSPLFSVLLKMPAAAPDVGGPCG